MREPNADALAAARNVQRRLRGRTSAPVRRQFIERPADGRAAPLATALRGGRGGTVRVKLELTFLWFAAKPPHDLAYPARAWATLLGLPDPAGRGARRINEAILWLEQHKLITVENRAGQPNVITLLSENGTGAPYELPGTAYNRLRNKKPASLADEHRYIQLPNELWTTGWLSRSGGTRHLWMTTSYWSIWSSELPLAANARLIRP